MKNASLFEQKKRCTSSKRPLGSTVSSNRCIDLKMSGEVTNKKIKIINKKAVALTFTEVNDIK